MILDIILCASVIVWAVYGYRKGFVRQIFVLAGVIAVSLFAAPTADIAEKVLANELDVIFTGRLVRMFLLAGCSAVIYILAYSTGYFLHKTLVKGIPLAEKTNHILGTILGITGSVIAIYFILCVFAVGHDKIQEYAPSVQKFMDSSVTYNAARDNNLIENFSFFNRDRKNSEQKKLTETSDQPAPQPDPPQKLTDKEIEKIENIQNDMDQTDQNRPVEVKRIPRRTQN